MSLDLMDILCLKKKDEAYVTNLDEYGDIGTHWIALDVKNIEIIYFDSFGVEHVPKKIIEHKNIKKTHLEYKQTIQ